jgi:hypothetical protein
VPAVGIVRTLIVGDSFAHGDEVALEETWFRQLEVRLPKTEEVWCGGVPGFGTDQALLRLEELIPDVKPSRAILTIYRMNLVRNLTFFRVIQNPKSGIPHSKPRFLKREDGSLYVENSPVVSVDDVPGVLRDYANHRLGKLDDLFDPELYRDRVSYCSRLFCYLHSRRAMASFMDRQNKLVLPGQLGFEWGVLLGEEFALRMNKLGIEPVIVLLPDHADLEQLLRNEASPMTALAEVLRAKGIRVIETASTVLNALGPGDAPTSLYVGGQGHPNARCSQAIAECLFEQLGPR